MKFASKFFRKWSFFDQFQQPRNRVKPFERILRTLFISQCPYKFSSFLDLRNAFHRLRLFSRDFRLFRFFLRDLHAFWNWTPPKFAKLSKILWKIQKFWKRISADQIHSGGGSLSGGEGQSWSSFLYRLRKSKARKGKGKDTHTGSKIGFPLFSKSETIETDWSRDGLRHISNNFRRGWRLQDRGAVQGRSESWQRVIAHRRGGREARLAWGGFRKPDAFLGHEMRGPAGTWLCLDGWRAGRPKRKEGKWV